jgi:hypothetical protein
MPGKGPLVHHDVAAGGSHGRHGHDGWHRHHGIHEESGRVRKSQLDVVAGRLVVFYPKISLSRAAAYGRRSRLSRERGPIAQIDEAAWAIQNGLARACSIGFLPDWSQVEKAVDAKGNWDGGLIFHKAELIECSLCGIPANPAALSKGFHGQPQAKGTRSFDKAVAHRLRLLEVDALKRGPPR